MTKKANLQPILLIVLVLIVFFAVLGIGTVWLFALIDPDTFDSQSALTISGLICLISLLLVPMGALPVWLISRINQRRFIQQLDPAFEALGLEARSSGLGMSGREYHGTVEGRELHVYYYRRYTRSMGSLATYQGSVLDIHVYTPTLKTRVGISLRNQIGQAINRVIQSKEVEIADPDYADVMAYAKDESWTSGFLENEEAKTRILHLINEPSPAGLGQVIIFPEMLNVKLLRLPEDQLTPDVARQWIEDAIALAEIAEDQPAPFEVIEPNRLERTIREGGSKQAMQAMKIVFGALFAILVVSLVGTGICIGLSFLVVGLQ